MRYKIKRVFRKLGYRATVDMWGDDYRVIFNCDWFTALKYVRVLCAVNVGDKIRIQCIIPKDYACLFLKEYK